MNAGFMAILALAKASKLTVATLIAEIERQFPALRGSVAAKSSTGVREDACLIEIREELVTVMTIDQPVPSGTFDRAASASLTWSGAQAELAAHRSHVIVANLNVSREVVTPIVQAEAVTYVVAAIAKLSPAIGVYWSAADAVTSATRLTDLARGLVQGSPPVDLWVGLRPFGGKGPDGVMKIGMATIGLLPLLSKEIDFQPVALPVQEIAGRLMSIIAYLLSNGPIFKDGDTLGLTAQERIRIRFGNRSGAVAVPVWELTVEAIHEPVQS